MNIIEEAHTFGRDVRLHKKLTSRLLLLSAISFFLLGAIILDLLSHRIEVGPVIEVWLLGFAFGVTIFGRIRSVVWDDETAAVSIAKMDTLGFVILVFYYVFDAIFEPIFVHMYHDATIVKGLLFALVFGTLAGRLANFAIGIHRAHRTRTSQ